MKSKELPEVRDKEGNLIELVHTNKAKVGRGNKHLLEKIPMYSCGNGEWYYEKKDIDSLA